LRFFGEKTCLTGVFLIYGGRFSFGVFRKMLNRFFGGHAEFFHSRLNFLPGAFRMPDLGSPSILNTGNLIPGTESIRKEGIHPRSGIIPQESGFDQHDGIIIPCERNSSGSRQCASGSKQQREEKK